MARIRWEGKQEIWATPIKLLPSGNWLMKAHSHGDRFTAGSEIIVTPDQILNMDAVRPVLDDQAAASLAQLEAAMATERETLPSPQSVIAANPPIAHDAPDKVVSVPTDPTQRP